MSDVATGNGIPPLRFSFSWVLGGSVCFAFANWVLLALVARYGTPQVVGDFSLAFALVGPVVMFSRLQLRGIAATDARRQHLFRDFCALRLLTTVLAVIAIAVVSKVAAEPILTLALLIGLAKAVESVSDLMHGFLQQHERMSQFATSLSIRSVLMLVAFGLAMQITGDIIWGAVSLVISNLIVLGLYDGPQTSRLLGSVDGNGLRPRWNPGQMRSLIRMSLPLGAVMLFGTLNVTIPKYVIAAHLPRSALGFYSVPASLMVAGGLLVGALGQSVSPRLARSMASGDARTFRRLTSQVTGIALLVGIAGVGVALVAGQAVLRLVFGAEYATYAGLLNWLMLAGSLAHVASILGYSLTAARRFSVQLPIVGSASAVLLLLSVWLVPRYELLGAAWALLAAFAVQIIASLWALSHALRLKRDGGVKCPT